MFGPFKRLRRLNGGPRVDGFCTQKSFNRALEKERYRSDRSDQQYALLVFALPPVNPASSAFQRAIRRIRARIRNVDEIGWYEKNRLGVILPYTTRDGAEKLAEEICALLSPCVPKDACIDCEIFCYAPNAAAEEAAP